MPIRRVDVESLSELIHELFDGSYEPHIERFRSPYAFRGMCADWPLLPSVHRLQHPPEHMDMIEEVLFRSFRRYSFQQVPPSTSEWKWLSIAQHHGLPTRLLDWSFSPFVALHFATNELDKMDRDAVVWMVNIVRARQWLPPRLNDELVKLRTSVFSVEVLEKLFPEIREVEALRGQGVEVMKGHWQEFVLFFEPPSLDERIVNQYGLFSFMNRRDARLDTWLDQHTAHAPDLAKKIVIPAKLKWEVRDKLDGMNLTERVLMPGLDGVSAWLKRWYTPKVRHTAQPAATIVPKAPQRAKRPARPAKKRGATAAE